MASTPPPLVLCEPHKTLSRTASSSSWLGQSQHTARYMTTIPSSFLPAFLPCRAQNFSGFRDMPYNPRMSRKPSTCSLPAALLAENRVTPCSSVDGLSPTDSTCSLDKAATLVSQGGRRVELYFPTNSSASQETPSVASYDGAILRAVTAPSSSTVDALLKTSPPHSVTSISPTSPQSHHLHAVSPPTTGQSDSSTVATLTRSSVAMSSSWADQLDAAEEDGREANTPEWAQLNQPDRNKGRSHPPAIPPKPTHASLTKRNSMELHDGRGHDDPTTPARPHHHPPPRNPAPVPSSWIQRPPPPHMHNSHPGGQHPSPHQSLNPVGVNGLPSFPPALGLASVLPRPAYVPGGGVVPGYPPALTNHTRGTHKPPPPVCFNCGKKGHYGTACPGETMDTNNPDSKPPSSWSRTVFSCLFHLLSLSISFPILSPSPPLSSPPFTLSLSLPYPRFTLSLYLQCFTSS